MNRDELYKLRRKLAGIDQLRQTITNLETMRVSPRAAAYGGSKVQTSPKGDVQPDNIQKIDKLLGKYNAELRGILEQVAEFEQAVKGLDDRPKEIMRAYFIQRNTWEKICVDVGISYSRVMQIRNDALDSMFGPLEKPDRRGGKPTAEGGGKTTPAAEGQ